MARFLYAVVIIGVAVAAAQTNYNAGDSGRSESVSPDGSVSGQYSYTDPNGKLITVKYRAGKDGFQVEGDHLPRAPQAAGAAPQASNPSGYNPFFNPNTQNWNPVAPTHPPPAPQHHQQAPAVNHHQAIANYVPKPHDNGYNPFFNPNVDKSPSAHANYIPQPHDNGYNPFYNPNVDKAPAHVQHHNPAPQHHSPQQAVPTHAQNPGHGYNPFYNKDIQNYNPLHNPHVPAHLYNEAPRQQAYQQPAPQNYNHPNAIQSNQKYGGPSCASCF